VAEAEPCPQDSVPVGPACVDKYEASVWATADSALIVKIKDGTVTLADLSAAGAIQRGVSGDDYDLVCPNTGNHCLHVYAVSIPGVTPSRFITWFQALAAARNSGKRLATNQEWQAAAFGTPDPGRGVAPGPQDCNTSSWSVDLTGARSNCVSDVGAFDMVGNAEEWVADWVPQSSSACPGWGTFSDDFMCLSGAHKNAIGPGALLRGGGSSAPSGAGVFAVLGFRSPSFSNFEIGLRAAR
jgi:hypothetical protein